MSDDLKLRIGRRVRALRERRGLTQEQLAEGIDRSVETVGNIERGQTLVAVDTLERIARFLGAPISDFFDDGFTITPARADVEARIRDAVRGLSDLEAEVALHLIEGLHLLHRKGSGRQRVQDDRQR
ncbi:helix-turn-helix transcriptional regulator [Azospirillum soli]|uniref:helix-turn-helix transcriptional regulator n=1 Tax=Azospirillum soli TaxID=1304799 RepID=UPI001AE96DBA|nr:helix-turn-helix transcriptional regulator [Azospirillum soli]MBP2311486.1 transcriptional regulator with XRE-family HTH domain [Azospirillum soli]